MKIKHGLFLITAFALGVVQLNAQNRCTYVRPAGAENIILQPNNYYHANVDNEEVLEFPIGTLPSKGSAAFTDTLGNLQLVSIGAVVYDEEIIAINNSSDMYGNIGSVQPGVFVPMPGDESQVYFFTTDIANRIPITELQDHGLNYHIIDISGVKKVTSKNNNLLEHCSEKISAVKHANNEDVWIAAHGWENNNFYVYKLTAEGLETETPSAQAIGVVHSYTAEEEVNPNIYESKNTTGMMKFSPDGSRLALALLGDNVVEVFDFDKATGQLSNPILLEHDTLTGAFGVEFSPNSAFLYVTATGSQDSNVDNLLLQMDITQSDASSILNTVVLLNDGALVKDVNSVQLTARRQMLVSRVDGSVVGLIQNPDRPGLLCNYVEDAVVTNLSNGVVALTNFATHYLDIPPFTWDTKCLNDQTVFEITNIANIESVVWEFNDPTGYTELGNMLSPIHIYSAPGDYPVSMTIRADGEEYVYEDTVTIYALPEPALGIDRYVFPGSSIELDPGAYYGYYWPDFEVTTPTVVVSETGTYSVEVEDINCCVSSDSVEVYFVPLHMPNAIRPQSAIVENQKFSVSGTVEGMSDFEMYIYNRWGQLVFDTEDQQEGWDATFKGNVVETGGYTYVIRFIITDEENVQRKISKTGTFVVVR